MFWGVERLSENVQNRDKNKFQTPRPLGITRSILYPACRATGTEGKRGGRAKARFVRCKPDVR